MPILIHKFQLATEEPPASGKWRGGLGIDMQFQVFAPNAILTTRAWSAVCSVHGDARVAP